MSLFGEYLRTYAIVRSGTNLSVQGQDFISFDDSKKNIFTEDQYLAAAIATSDAIKKSDPKFKNEFEQLLANMKK